MVNNNTLKILSISIFIFTVNSCQTFIDVGDNFVRQLSSPEKVIKKVKDPIRKDVKLSALWIGHASFLLQIYDKVILIDPVFTNNVAQVLRRYAEPGLDLNSLKKIDMVLISHSHMDHLSLGSLSDIEDKFHGTDIVFPAGVENYLPDYDMNFIRMNFTDYRKKFTGETKLIDSVKITAVPAVHWGGRYGLDGKFFSSNGYCGFIIEYRDVTVYYTSDTSYEPDLFKYIGDNYDIDLVLVNIIYCKGCTEINQGTSHILPMGAIKILDDTKAEYMIPAHFGMFTDPNVQIRELKKMYLTNDEYKRKVKILNIGEQFVIKSSEK